MLANVTTKDVFSYEKLRFELISHRPALFPLGLCLTANLFCKARKNMREIEVHGRNIFFSALARFPCKKIFGEKGCGENKAGGEKR